MGNIKFKTESGSEYAVEYSGSLSITEDYVSGVAEEIRKGNQEFFSEILKRNKELFDEHVPSIRFIFHNGVFTAAPEDIFEDTSEFYLQTSPLVGSLEIKDDAGKKTTVELPSFDPQTWDIIPREEFIMKELKFLTSPQIINQKDSSKDHSDSLDNSDSFEL